MADELSQEIITYFVQKQKGAEELSKEKGNKESNELVFTTSPNSPIKSTLMGSFWLISYSDNVCLQAPQGPIGLSTLEIDELAEIANFLILTPGKSEPAFQIATLSAHIPEGYAAFSWLLPKTIWLFSNNSAAPTLNFD